MVAKKDDAVVVESMSKTGWGTIAGYALGAFLTFGHVFNMNYVEPTPVVDCGVSGEPGEPTWEPHWTCRNANIKAEYSSTGVANAFVAGLTAGAAWPLYWAGHYAIKVTK